MDVEAPQRLQTVDALIPPECTPDQPTPIQWLESLETGNATIDGEHRALIAQCNALRELVADPCRGALAEAIADLRLALANHFASEAEILLSTRFERLDAHRREHQEILDRMSAFARQAESANAVAERVEIIRAIGLLLIEMMIHDLDYKSHLQFTSNIRLFRGRRRLFQQRA